MSDINNTSQGEQQSQSSNIVKTAILGKTWGAITGFFSSGYLWLWVSIAAVLLTAILALVTYVNSVAPIFTTPLAGANCSSTSSSNIVRQELEKITDDASRQKALEEFDEYISRQTSSDASSACIGTFNGEIAVPLGSAINEDGTFYRPSGVGISSPYGPRCLSNGDCSFHPAIDIYGPAETPIVSAMDGTVIYKGPRGAQGELGGGNITTIQHADGIKTRYVHMETVNVKVGDTVKAGQQIGTMGNTGYSFGRHLHFEVIVNNKAVDPQLFYKSQGIDLYELFGQPTG